MTSFKLNTEYIELIKLLKASGIAENGGHAQALVEANQIKVNGAVETRKRAKLKAGDVIETPFGNIKLE
ncbi:RNA-binding S4 domain-containing protein [Solitalea lacus]|uniref:RNA-binding S4 domain-containing protein n=1 Tax=Solitalea lacus TaxID=2911172 RepID=UPI001EDAF887|nr:RNA-binding S4 domain-containing protein [Solitalea lacus]UKJ07766.1 RNA-binding S4 domain-containing protein [Solitalea lacus]